MKPPLIPCRGGTVNLGSISQQWDALDLVGTGHHEYLVGQIALVHRLRKVLSSRVLQIADDDDLLGGGEGGVQRRSLRSWMRT